MKKKSNAIHSLRSTFRLQIFFRCYGLQKWCRAFVGFSSGSLAGDLLQAILTDFEEVNDEY